VTALEHTAIAVKNSSSNWLFGCF